MTIDGSDHVSLAHPRLHEVNMDLVEIEIMDRNTPSRLDLSSSKLEIESVVKSYENKRIPYY